MARLTSALDKNRYDIIIAAGPDGDNETGLLSFLEKKGINTRHLKYLRRSVNPLFDFCLGIIEIYKLIKKERPDILFLCSSKAGAMGSLAGRIGKVPKIIYRIGGWTFNDPRSWFSCWFYRFIEKTSAKWKDYIVNNAESDKQQAIKLGIKPRKEILTIYNGIDIDKLGFYSKEEARKKILNTSYQIQNASLVGTIANFYPAKGLKYLVEAARLLRKKNIKFIVIGGGQKRKKLEVLIKKHDLENVFFLAGAIPEAYRYLKAFDAFVLPSLKEGFPWTILEAMAAEVPVIATKVGAIPEIIESNKNGLLVEPRNPKQIAEAIAKLLNDENLRKKLAENGRKVVIEKFNLEKMIQQYENLFSLN